VRIHIEGMGVNGCLLALQLHQQGLGFTWHDRELVANAHRACTGAVYPSGSAKFGPDMACHALWESWYEKGVYGDLVERASYVFTSKHPPHEGRYPSTRLKLYDVGVANPGTYSYHLNAQWLVQQTRDFFQYARMTQPPDAAGVDWYVISHGWTERLAYVYWGWTRLVELRAHGGAPLLVFGLRPAIYHRPHKFLICYAYPVPGTPWWYAGSHIIKQSTTGARELEVEPKYERWKREFLQATRGGVEIAQEGEFLQGWRPAARDDAWLQRTGNVLSLRPLWNSGVRHFPLQWALVKRSMGLAMTDQETDLCKSY
jgi:hypothetical protein